jgi:hypothetical protein
MLLQLAKKFGRGGDEEFIRKRVTELRGKQRQLKSSGDDAEQPARLLSTLGVWDQELLEILLLKPDAIRSVIEVVRPEHLSSEAGRRVFAACCSLAEAGTTPSFNCLLSEFDDPAYKNLLVELDERGQQKGPHDLAVRLHELLEGFRRRDRERHVRAQTRALQERKLGAAEELVALQALIDQERRRQGISAPTDG